MQLVATSRGASGWRCDCQTRRLPTSCAPSAKIMCGIIPLPHWPRNNARISSAARGASSRAIPMAVKHESHNHWCGYSFTDGHVYAPRRLRSRTARARPGRSSLSGCVADRLDVVAVGIADERTELQHRSSVRRAPVGVGQYIGWASGVTW